MKFELGSTVVTKCVDEYMKKDPKFKRFVEISLGRYARCDWGNTCDEDKQENDRAIENGERILAAYVMPHTDVKIWIITEWDRSVTTILFPDEY